MSQFEDEAIKATVELGKEVASDLVKPTAQSVGNNIGLFVDGAMGWLGYWGEKQKIKREVYLKQYKQTISKNIEEIPSDKLIEPAAHIVGPAIEASKYHIEEPTCRDMFAKLIASACNADLESDTHPSFPDIVRQLSPTDAKFLALFRSHSYYPAASIKELHKDGIVTPYPYMMFDLGTEQTDFPYYKDLELTSTVELLERFGLLVKNDEVLALDYDYESFRNNWFYKILEKGFKSDSEVVIHKYRLELSVMGKKFLKCCVPEKFSDVNEG